MYKDVFYLDSVKVEGKKEFRKNVYVFVLHWPKSSGVYGKVSPMRIELTFKIPKGS